MEALLKEFLRRIEVTPPVAAGPLQLFGLISRPAEPLPYLTLDEALESEALDVTEVSEEGSVPQLQVKNRGKTWVFLMAGEQLIGAKQNRVLNTSIMVAAASDLVVPVTCVEAGRWGYRSSKFGSHATSSHSVLRKMMSRDVSESYRLTSSASAKQREVWREVSRKLSSMGSSSASDALDQVYEDHRSRIDDVVRQAALPEGCSGVAFAFGGRIAGVDLFDTPRTLSKLFPKLVRAYVVDALEAGQDAAEVAPDAVAQWLRSADSASFEAYDSPGLGVDVRIESPSLAGAGLVIDDRPVHVELFPEHEV